MGRASGTIVPHRAPEDASQPEGPECWMRARPPPREGLRGKHPGLRQPPAEARGGSTSAETLRHTPISPPPPYCLPEGLRMPHLRVGSVDPWRTCSKTTWRGQPRQFPGSPRGRKPSLPAQAPASPTWGCGRWPGLAGGELMKLLSRPQQTPPGEGPGQVSPLRGSNGRHRILACALHCWARRTTK